MRTLVRILVPLIPASQQFIPSLKKGGGNRTSEKEIRVSTCRVLVRDATVP
jgi:hypothetical protein